MYLMTVDVAFSSFPPAFEYTACDPSGECNTATVTVTVDPNGDGPVAFDDREDTTEGESVIVDVLGNDRPPDLVVTDVSEPANGVCAITEDNQVMYTPDDGFVGRDQCTCESNSRHFCLPRRSHEFSSRRVFCERSRAPILTAENDRPSYLLFAQRHRVRGGHRGLQRGDGDSE